jgi:YVTN family beta-propeller protein
MVGVNNPPTLYKEKVMKFSKNVLRVCLIGLSLIVQGVQASLPRRPTTVIGCVENNYAQYPTCRFNGPATMAMTPIGITPAKAYVCNAGVFGGSSSISVIDVATDTVIKCVENDYAEYPNCPFNQPLGIAITPDGTKAYVSNTGGKSVSVIDVATDTVIACVDNDYAYCPFNVPFGIAITPLSVTPAKAYVCNAGGNSVSVIDVATDTVIKCVENDYAEYPNCPFNEPFAIAITPLSVTPAKAYVCNAGGNSVSVIDVATDTVIKCVENDYAEYPNCPFNEPFAIAITSNGKKAYVCNYAGNSVSVIDVDTDTVIKCVENDYAEYPNCPFNKPFDIAITLDGSTAYVCNFEGHSVTMIDVATDTVIGCVEPDNYPGCPFFAPSGIVITPDGSKAYVANEFGNSVSIIGAPPTPPNNVQGVRSCHGTELILTITWNASNDSTVTSYNIYNGATLVGNVSAAGSLTFSTPLISPDEGLNFFVSAVSPTGESTKVAVPTYGPTDCSFTPSILPPASVSGCKTRNRFLLQTDFINNITWTAPASGTTPVAYKIYRDAYLTDLVATVPASGALQYYDHDRNPGIVYSYYIVSVDGSGNVSTANSVTVTNPC